MSKTERLKAFCASASNDPFAWYSLAMAQREEGPESSVGTFRRIHDEHPEYLANYYQYGQVLADTDKTDEAKTILREGIQLAAQQGDAHTKGELETALLDLG